MSLRAALPWHRPPGQVWRSNLLMSRVLLTCTGVRRKCRREENPPRNDMDAIMPWDPKQYHKFQAERSAPFFDLLALVEIRPHLKVVDLGCGTGELTRQLADALPDSDVTGIDFSSQMLEKASAFTRPGLHFEQGDQAGLTGEWDLIFSNAALHWTENHAELIPNLYRRLTPGGQIAIQIPSNHNHISHQVYRETADEEPFKTILKGF